MQEINNFVIIYLNRKMIAGHSCYLTKVRTTNIHVLIKLLYFGNSIKKIDLYLLFSKNV